MKRRHSVLLVEDDRMDQMAFERFVKSEGLAYDYMVASSISQAREMLAATQFDVVLADYALGGGTALDLLGETGDTPVVVITGGGDEQVAVKAMKAGASDYLVKDPAGSYLKALPVTVENAIQHKRIEGELERYQESLEQLVEERTAELTRVNTQLLAEIAERKRAEEAMKEYSERLEEMVEERTRVLRGAQEQLIRKERLAVLGQLAGSVAHELRNPLGAISNAVYFLNMVLEDLDPRAKETLEILEKEVKTSERIISGLLDFARAGPPIQRRVDLNGVLQGVLSRMTVPQGIEVVSQLDESLPTILADPDQIAQVFGNVILNGFQSMPEGGRLVIKAEVPSPKWSVVSFSDTGVGIPEENLARVFEPLFTTKAKGIGLGLSVVREIVERHGGWVTVESEEGVGSTFAIWLPLSD